MKSSVHPLFKESKAYFDIAILESAPIKISAAISPICLPSSVINYDYYAAHLIGWGAKNPNGPPSNTLQRVVLSIFPQRYQVRFYNGDIISRRRTQSQVPKHGLVKTNASFC